MREWLVLELRDSRDTEWESLNDVPTDTSYRQLALKLRLGVNVREVDLGRRGVSMAQLNPQDARQLADMPAGDSTAGASIRGTSKRVPTELALGTEEQIEGDARMKMAKVAAAPHSVDQIHKFETIAGRVTMLKVRGIWILVLGRILRYFEETAFPTFKRGNFFVASIFTRWRNFPALPPSRGNRLQYPGIRYRAGNESSNAGI